MPRAMISNEIQAFPLLFFGRTWLDLARFGKNLDLAWIEPAERQTRSASHSTNYCR
jgi:hypothetical protein